MKAIRVLAFIEASSLTGPAKNLIEFARRTAARQTASVGINLEIATFRRSNSLAPDEFVLACQKANIEIHVIRERFAFDLAVLPQIRGLISALNPDIVQTHNVKSHFLIRLIAGYRQRRWIAFHHGYTWTDLKARLYNQLDRWSLLQASKVVTVCRSFAHELEHLGIRRERIAVRHNSVRAFLPASEERVLELKRSLGVTADTQVLLSIGRLSREKGQADLIEALSLIRKQESQRKLLLIVIGVGPESRTLKNTAKKLGVANWVVFAGHQADVAPYYTLANLMVLPSHTEGSPNVLLEAMAAGLPIIATAVGGVPEMVTSEKEAILVEVSNPGALARAIKRILGDDNLRMQLSGAARSASSIYSPEAYYDFMVSLYRSCFVENS
jgi:glycosyltransferase involved in cell wall biosynthesis